MTNPVIVIYVPKYPANTETFIADLVVGLRKRGICVQVVCLNFDKEAYSKRGLDLYEYRVIQLNRVLSSFHSRVEWMLKRFSQFKLIANALFWWSAWTSWKDYSVNLIEKKVMPGDEVIHHAHWLHTGYFISKKLFGKNQNLLVTCHGYDITKFSTRIQKRLFGSLRKNKRMRYVCHSNFILSRFPEHEKNRTPIVPLGVDGSVFRAPRKSWLWEDTTARVNIIFVGRLVPYKNPDIALEAAVMFFRASGYPGKLRIIGSGPLISKLEEKKSLLQAQGRVEILGYQPREVVAQYMQDADILILPSGKDQIGTMEGFGVVALEARASGCYVIGSGSGGVPEAVGKGGCIVDELTPRAFSEAISTFVNRDSSRISPMKIRSDVLQSHSIDHYIDSYINEYQSLLSN